MSLRCTSVDVGKFDLGNDAFDSCVVALGDNKDFPTRESAVYCLGSIGVSTECSQCWGNAYNDFKTCFIGTCEFTLTTSVDTQLSNNCINCLIDFRDAYYTDGFICDAQLQALPADGTLGEIIAPQIQKWLAISLNRPASLPADPADTVDTDSTASQTSSLSKSAPRPSVRSITLGIFIIATTLFTMG
jgi:hypothetical protein